MNLTASAPLSIFPDFCVVGLYFEVVTTQEADVQPTGEVHLIVPIRFL